MAEGGLRAALAGRVLLFDGGMGTELIARGLGEGEPSESFVLSCPDALREIHTAYLEAGAEVLQTCTFGANRLRLDASPAGRSLDVARVNEEAVAALRRVVDAVGATDRLVAGDIGPTGLYFSPVGELTEDAARDAFRDQAAALDRGGVDLFLIETMSDVREAAQALRAVREVSGRPVVALVTFDRKPRGFFTVMGDTPAKAAEVLLAEGADAVGANCTLGSEPMADLAREFRAATDAPLVLMPNAGQPILEGDRLRYEQRPEAFAADMVAAVRAGASAVGGCCGTTPAFIRALRDRLRQEGVRP